MLRLAASSPRSSKRGRSGPQDVDGLALARRLRETDSSLRILLTSTDPTLVAPAKLADGAAVAFVPKDRLAITALAPLLGD